jgi:hypothetical protein
MLISRIIAAFRFRRSVYAEVEQDTSFTTTAWILVVVIAFLSQLGASASPDLLYWLIGTIGGTIFAVMGFVVAALVIGWVGRILFKAEVNSGELVRTLGLAYVWQIVGVLGVVTAFTDVFYGELTIIIVLGLVMLVIAWIVAAKEALDLGWLPTGIAVVAGWVAQFAITTFAGRLAVRLLALVLDTVG